jgi:hypothetical protein
MGFSVYMEKIILLHVFLLSFREAIPFPIWPSRFKSLTCYCFSFLNSEKSYFIKYNLPGQLPKKKLSGKERKEKCTIWAGFFAGFAIFPQIIHNLTP